MKIFENATFSDIGIYMPKIFMSHEWKCLIIDDFIPVTEESGKMKPLFTSLKFNSQDEEI